MRTILGRIARMTRYRIIPALLLAVLGSCTHSSYEGDREPAAQFAKACEKLDQEELKLFHSLIRSEQGIAASTQYLNELARYLRIDPGFFRESPVSMEALLSREHGYLYGHAELYGKILLEQCNVIRNGEDLNACVRKAHTKKTYAREVESNPDLKDYCGPYISDSWANGKKLCGPHDKNLSEAERSHGKTLRNWVLYEFEHDLNLRLWIAKENNVFDPVRNELVSPDKALEFCTGFQSVKENGQDLKQFKNIEDAIENMFLCIDSFVLALREYDPEKQRYARDEQGDFKLRKYSNPFKKCLEGYVERKAQRELAQEPDVSSGD